MSKKHSQFCEGHVMCPNTGKKECGKVVVHRVVLLEDGSICEEPVTVHCFGCGETHNVKERER